MKKLSDPRLPKILLVDDQTANLVALRALLDGLEADLISADSGNDALGKLLTDDFALVLLDVQMPGMDGFEVAELMRSNGATQHIPIIFVTAISTERQYIFQGYSAGAVDYLPKPIDPHVLCSKVNVFLRLYRQQDELARTIAELREANRRILLQQEALRELAIHDHLTGLYQRRWFDEMIRKETAKSLRGEVDLALAIVDIDHFKQINDNHGHGAGDAILAQLARMMATTVRDGDTAFRLGGDEFAVLMPQTDRQAAIFVCERIRAAVTETIFQHDGRSHAITISIGLATLHELSTPNVKALIDNADSLLYRAKAQGRNRVNGGRSVGAATLAREGGPNDVGTSCPPTRPITPESNS